MYLYKMPRFLSLCGPLALGALTLLTSGAARAALGEPESSIQSDSVKLKANHRVLAANPSGYTIHELDLGHTLVRELLNADGVVFAVTWRGPFKPDLTTLLGSYFSTYAQAPRSAGSSRSHLLIDEHNLVVRAGGHPRAFTGLAYIPQLLPAGVKPGDLL